MAIWSLQKSFKNARVQGWKLPLAPHFGEEIIKILGFNVRGYLNTIFLFPKCQLGIYSRDVHLLKSKLVFLYYIRQLNGVMDMWCLSILWCLYSHQISEQKEVWYKRISAHFQTHLPHVGLCPMISCSTVLWAHSALINSSLNVSAECHKKKFFGISRLL